MAMNGHTPNGSSPKLPELELLGAVIKTALKDARAGVPSATRSEARRWLETDGATVAELAGWDDVASALRTVNFADDDAMDPAELAARFGVSEYGARFSQSEAMQAEAAHRARADRLGVMPQYLSRQEN